ncbi:Endothiapepsin [Metarhizium brunneum]|uniref:Endothiapepsin n=1 Tax=Metarhizium brunneum TaxID=500148 RepID=A0A7D5UYD3_9HYPO
MQTFGRFLVSLVAASSLAAGAPKESFPSKNGKFSITAKHNVNFERNGPLALAKAYNKLDKPVPQDIADAVTRIQQKRETGSVTNTPNKHDQAYLAPVQIGTPPQTLNLIFDTGSADFWVFSNETASNEVKGQIPYDPKKSSTSKRMSGASWSIEYADNGTSVSGDVYTDIVTVGGLSVKSQAFASAKNISAYLSRSLAASGILGLAFSKANRIKPQKQQTFFDNAKATLDAPLFTVDLKHQADGKYNFGYIDSSAHTGLIAYTSVDSTIGGWGFTSPGFAVGDGSFTNLSISGIIDTGATLLLLPDNVVKAYYSKVKGASYDESERGYTFGCSTTLPSFSFWVGNSTITIPGSYMNYQATNDSGKTCFGGLQSSSGYGVSIFGDVALKAAFVVFDAGNNRLGWAAKNL